MLPLQTCRANSGFIKAVSASSGNLLNSSDKSILLSSF